MIEIKGAYNTAICYTPALEELAECQIRAVCDTPAFSACKLRIMPDVHAGAGCTIGTTMTVHDRVVPNMVGVDIGCGMETVRLAECEIDFAALDALIREQIPCGRNVRRTPHAFAEQICISELRCARYVDVKRAVLSIGSLGGGNHFIEIDRDEEGNLYLVVHSGSRHLGCEVAEYYQTEGYRHLCGNAKDQILSVIEALKREGREQEIQHTVDALRANCRLPDGLTKALAYVEGDLFNDYIHDMRITQTMAMLNRKAMVDVILTGLGLTEIERFTTVHNYIDTEEMILRKGAVSAKAGEKLLIPINMRDGALVCIGKGNEDWNCSAPHGAGRLMSRRAAFERLSLAEYQKEMEGIWSSCISKETLDEAPMAYKQIDEIVRELAPTAEIVARIKPLYKFKAAE